MGKPFSNSRPGYSPIVLKFRSIANSIRTMFYFCIKARYVKRKGMVRIPWDVYLWSPHRHIILGDCVQFRKGCVVECDVEFGNDILIARNVAFIGRNDHRYDVVGKTIWDSPRGDSSTVVVEDDVWIGHGAIVLSGVTIGKGSVVAAGSVVIHDVPPYSVVGGNPAVIIKGRFSQDDIQKHERMLSAEVSYF